MGWKNCVDCAGTAAAGHGVTAGAEKGTSTVQFPEEDEGNGVMGM